MSVRTMQVVILTGIPGAGKSWFYRERFFSTHMRINLDMLRTRHREWLLFEACLEAQQSLVVDNTNLTREERARYIEPARRAGFEVVGYYFPTTAAEALQRNAGRPAEEQVPEVAVYAGEARLEPPQRDEGFDRLYTVRVLPDGGYHVEEGVAAPS